MVNSPLSKGAKGPRVQHLQRRLASVGKPLKDDGDYGDVTERAVREWQAANELKDDGIVGPLTTAALRRAPAPDAPGAPADSPDPLTDPRGPAQPASAPVEDEAAPAAKPERPKRTLAPVLFKGVGVGDARSSQDVAMVQADLGAVGYEITVDGRFGPQTEQVTRRFQKRYGLKTDGIVGQKTRRTLLGALKGTVLAEARFEAAPATDWSDVPMLRIEEANAGFEKLIALFTAQGFTPQQAVAMAMKVVKGAKPTAARGGDRKAKIEMKRLPDGQFAPAGQGQILRPGQVVDVPHKSGQGHVQGVVTNKGKVKLANGPDAGVNVPLPKEARASARGKGYGKDFIGKGPQATAAPASPGTGLEGASPSEPGARVRDKDGKEWTVVGVGKGGLVDVRDDEGNVAQRGGGELTVTKLGPAQQKVADFQAQRPKPPASPGTGPAPKAGNVGGALKQVANGKTASMSAKRKQDLVSRGLAKWDGPGEISLTDKGRAMLAELRPSKTPPASPGTKGPTPREMQDAAAKYGYTGDLGGMSDADAQKLMRGELGPKVSGEDAGREVARKHADAGKGQGAPTADEILAMKPGDVRELPEGVKVERRTSSWRVTYATGQTSDHNAKNEKTRAKQAAYVAEQVSRGTRSGRSSRLRELARRIKMGSLDPKSLDAEQGQELANFLATRLMDDSFSSDSEREMFRDAYALMAGKPAPSQVAKDARNAKRRAGKKAKGADAGREIARKHVAKGADAYKPDKNGVYNVGSDVNAGADLLAQGKPISLSQPREVSTLLTELARRVQEAKAKGDKAPNFDLCKVTVPGTNLFCAESKGVPRIKMPQLVGKPLPGSRAEAKVKKDGEADLTDGFRRMLEESNVRITDEEEQASRLRASQIELNGAKVAAMTAVLDGGGQLGGDPRIFVSKDGYVVDGHHRWAANVGHDLADNKAGDVTMPIARVDMDILELLAAANDYAKEMGLPQAGVTETAAEAAKKAKGGKTLKPPPASPGTTTVDPKRKADVDTKVREALKAEEAQPPQQSFADIDALYGAAEATLPEFKELLTTELPDALGATVPSFDEAMKAAASTPAQPQVLMGPLKKRKRAVEKMEAKFGGDPNKLMDIVRATVLVGNHDEIAGALDAVRSRFAAAGWQVRGAKDRFSEQGPPPPTVKGPTPAGYSDVTVFLVSPSGVAAELQFNTNSMFLAKEGEGHKLFEEQRTIEAKIKRRYKHFDAREELRKNPDKLPEAPDLYFNTDANALKERYGQNIEVDEVELSKMQTTRAREGGISRAKPLMVAAGRDAGGRRDPITLVRVKGAERDTFRVYDGNSTVAVAKGEGWSKLPAIIVDSDEEAAAVEAKMKELKSAPASPGTGALFVTEESGGPSAAELRRLTALKEEQKRIYGAARMNGYGVA